jgi:hypothetical protein
MCVGLQLLFTIDFFLESNQGSSVDKPPMLELWVFNLFLFWLLLFFLHISTFGHTN